MSQRVSEIGIRMALGATPAKIRWMVIVKGLKNTVIGLILGTLLSFLITRGMLVAFQGVEVEYVSLVLAILVLLIVSMAANILPARRAARLDPMHALRVQ